VRIPERVIVLGPNHTGLGEPRSLWAAGRWLVPGGSVRIDEDLAALLAERGALTPDHAAHLREHAIEVQLPLLQARRPDVRIVPICLARLSLDECLELGAALAGAIAEIGTSDVLIVASTDMSHYLPVKVAEQLDRVALTRVLSIDPEGLYEVVTRHDISMCGYVPTTVALAAARELSAKRAELVRYGNSGEVSGDLARVVGYASVMVA
jgi:AmmeMemoRadiSam system protein B